MSRTAAILLSHRVESTNKVLGCKICKVSHGASISCTQKAPVCLLLPQRLRDRCYLDHCHGSHSFFNFLWAGTSMLSCGESSEEVGTYVGYPPPPM